MNASDLYEEWHINYTGNESLEEYLMEGMGWNLLQAQSWLAGVEYDGEGRY